MKCIIFGVIFLMGSFSFSLGMTIHLFDIAAHQSSIEDGSLLTRIFFSKNITRRLPIHTPDLDGTANIVPRNVANRFHSASEEEGETTQPYDDESEIDEVFDSWSIVWYIASFSGLILFFLIVSCSEWCCRNRIRRQQQQDTQTTQSTTSQTDMRVIATRSQPEQQPPPPYDQFAPPSYDSLLSNVVRSNGTGDVKKSEYEVYVVPVHTMTTILAAEGAGGNSGEEAPPSYVVLNMQPSARPQYGSTQAQDHSARPQDGSARATTC